MSAKSAEAAPQANVDSEFFKNALRRRQISQRGLAKHLGISPAAVTLMLRGVRRMQATEAADIANLLGLHVSEVLDRAGIQTKREAHCPIRHIVDAKGDMAPRKDRASVTMPLACSAETIAARCEDPASPRFGWVYYYEPMAGVDVTAHGRLAVVQTKDGRALVASCTPGFDGPGFVLQRENGVTEVAELSSASPIAWIKLLIS